ncbi:NlpC/P60 family protein [Clostridium baratii]|uniref:Probable cell wall-binding protein n=1 Tax=Clostridium baratii TaxID=1561 RepID=A0A174VGN9_9CLOT|nr:NlpC/P60 family protein [Clostridium baratii]CUQ30269.1 probable cell wall-binding protein [Clostridium baratii]
MGAINKILKRFLKYILLSNLGITIIILVIFTGILAAYETQNSNASDIEYSSLNGVPQEFIPFFNEASSIFNIPNWVLAAVAKQESNFNPKDQYQGAYGIMQFQKTDIGGGGDLWASAINEGLGEVYKKCGYSFSSSEDMWGKFLNDPKAQIIAGAYEVRYYINYVLWRKGKVKKLDYNNSENVKLIPWNANENNSEFKELFRRIFACYNGGPGYGMSVNLDTAQNNYPNKVFKYAMEFRSSGLTSVGIKGDNATIESAINAGMKWVGKSPYSWGSGRNEADRKAGRFDCSSFVHYCYSSAGIKLGDIGATTETLLNYGKKVSKNNLKRGDIIFFDTYQKNGHVAIYLGNNKFLHDGSSKGVSIGDLNNSYYKQTFKGEARRIIN